MDPVTHALLGGAAARVALSRPLGAAAFAPGILGALLPDLDALARLSSDPLLHVVLHRHFTHSLAFVPFGAALAASPWLVRRRTRGRRGAYLLAAGVGWATHGPIDAATTYGTSLLWPFSDVRIGWSWISILDPAFTLALAAGVALSAWRRHALPAAIALVACALHLAHGAFQHGRALEAQTDVAASRGHSVVRGDVFPTVANHVLWRSLYVADGVLHRDRIRVPWSGVPEVASGDSVSLLVVDDVDHGDRAAMLELRRFSRFTRGWMARAPGDPTFLGDARYSLTPERYRPVWGIRLDPGLSPPVEWIDRSRDRRVSLSRLWAAITGTDSGFEPISGSRRKLHDREASPGLPGR